MTNKEMKTLSFNDVTYEIVDEKARKKIENNTVSAYLTGLTSPSETNKEEIYDKNVYLTDKEGQIHVKSLQIGGCIFTFDEDTQMTVISFN